MQLSIEYTICRLLKRASVVEKDNLRPAELYGAILLLREAAKNLWFNKESLVQA